MPLNSRSDSKPSSPLMITSTQSAAAASIVGGDDGDGGREARLPHDVRMGSLEQSDRVRRKRTIGAAGVLLAGAAIVVILGLTRRDLPEVVLAIGATLIVAWLVERGRRFIGSGSVLLGLGIGLVLAEHVAHGDYRDQLIFAGIGTGLVALRVMHVPAVLPAALGLLSVALFEFALQYLPTVLHADRVYRAFDDGWAFGCLIGVEALMILLTSRPHQGSTIGDRTVR